MKSKVKPIKKNNLASAGDMQPTGLPVLDFILHGGIPRGSDILLAGSSGTGKTILSLQWLFAGYDKYHESGLYISLTEPISKTLKNCEKFSFYKADHVGPLQVYFTDMRGIMEGMDVENKEITFEDIDQITRTLKLMVDQSKAKRVVIDSITALAYLFKDRAKIREFIFKLGTLLAQNDTTVILISEVPGEGYSVYGTEEFISDGIIKLSPIRSRGEIVRQLEVIKLRGNSFESAPTTFRITNDGIVFFPHLNRYLTYPVSTEKVPIGTEGLEEMTSGGLFKGSATLISGPSGTGKTILGLQFIAKGLSSGDKCLIVSFEESEDQLKRLANSLGIDLDSKIKSGQLQLMCAYPEQYYLEEHMDRIKSKLEDFPAKRVLIDSLSAVSTVYSSDLLPDFNSRLISFFKQLGTTSIFTLASNALMSSETISNAHLSTLYDNIIMLRYIEYQAELKHMILVLKMRGTSHDKKLREFVFTPKGIKVTTPFTGLANALTGEIRKVSETAEEQFHNILIAAFGSAGEDIFASEKAKGLSIERITKILDDFVNQKLISRRSKEELTQTITQLMS